jgi:hypothetical protein
MWGSRPEGEVTCIACGATLPRSRAREYDKHGDRWGERDREFEFLCKPCHRECCHQPRADLEDTLVKAGAGTTDRERFLARYHEVVRSEERGREPERE